jgi:hypothetical protein
MSDVVVEGERVVVDPHRPTVVRNPIESLPITRDVLELRVDMGANPIDVDAAVVILERRRIEERHGGNVEVGASRLERKER